MALTLREVLDLPVLRRALPQVLCATDRLDADVRQVAADGATALAVELGTTYADELPSGLVEAAAAAGLPLVALRRRVRFVEVTRDVHAALMDRRFALL